jgi:hypothetical protein
VLQKYGYLVIQVGLSSRGKAVEKMQKALNFQVGEVEFSGAACTHQAKFLPDWNKTVATTEASRSPAWIA